MLKTITTETRPSHKHLGRKTASAIVSGCLALSICPAIAFATPGEDGQPQQGGEPFAMMQFDADQDMFQGQGIPSGQAPTDAPSQDFGGSGDQRGQQPPADQGQAPDGQQQPSDQGQAPDGQSGQRPNDMGAPGFNGPQGGPDDETSNQVRSILSETYEVTSSQPAQGQAPNGQFGQSGQPGQPANGQVPDGNKASQEAPVVPDGEVNVQQIIDSVRDMIRNYGSEVLSSADFTDSEWNASATEYLTQANATRFTQTQDNQQEPAGMQQDPASAEKPNAGESVQESASVDKSLLNKLVAFVMSVFG